MANAESQQALLDLAYYVMKRHSVPSERDGWLAVQPPPGGVHQLLADELNVSRGTARNIADQLKEKRVAESIGNGARWSWFIKGVVDSELVESDDQLEPLEALAPLDHKPERSDDPEAAIESIIWLKRRLAASESLVDELNSQVAQLEAKLAEVTAEKSEFVRRVASALNS